MLRPEQPRTETAPARWQVSAALFVCVAALAAAFGPLFNGVAWWWASIAIAALVLGISQLARSMGLSMLWSAVAALVGWVLVMTAAFASESALLGVIPTPSTFSALARLFTAAREVASEESAPVGANAGLIFVLALGIGGLALGLDILTFWLRSPAVTGIALFGLLAVPGLVSGDKPSLLAVVLLISAWVWLLRLDVRRKESVLGRGHSPRMRLAVLAILVGTIAGSVIAPAILPNNPAPRGPFVAAGSGVGFEVGINPMIDLGRDLRRGNPTTSLRYRSTGGPTYLKVVNLYGFNGQMWRPGTNEPRTNRDLGDLGDPLGLSDDVETKKVTTSISIDALRSPWLPLPYPTKSIDGLNGDWRSEGNGLTVATNSARLTGQTYEARSLRVTPTANQARNAPQGVPDGFDKYIDLPSDVPPRIAATARAVTKSTDNHYDQALALQDYFRNGEYTYSETAPIEQGYDGNGLRVLDYFLVVKSGYCVHFSSAMAVMARTLGIPSRIAVGYLPGDVVGTNKDGEEVHEVSSDNLHAWPELYFEGIGWLAFEPTPSRGVATSLAEPSVSATPTPEAPSASADAENIPDSLLQDTESSDQEAAAQSSSGGTVAVLAVCALVALGLLPAAVRLAQRPWRMRQMRSSERPASVAWTELEATARDLGIPIHASDTPRTVATRMSELVAGPEPWARLLGRVERERFGRVLDPTTDHVYREECATDVAAGSAALRASASRMVRLRARMTPRSLFARRPRANASLVES
ncbi:DUF3488 and transglutaminase-like domain-containing protein [soil metagenome]